MHIDIQCIDKIIAGVYITLYIKQTSNNPCIIRFFCEWQEVATSPIIIRAPNNIIDRIILPKYKTINRNIVSIHIAVFNIARRFIARYHSSPRLQVVRCAYRFDAGITICNIRLTSSHYSTSSFYTIHCSYYKTIAYFRTL